MDRLPIVYVRGYAGPTTGIDEAVDDPFYGFNRGATHIRVGGAGDPVFYQFEGPLLRLMTDEGYHLLVHGDQRRYLDAAAKGTVRWDSLWVHRFYDEAATTFVPRPHEGVIKHVFSSLHRAVTSDGFDIERAAAGLYELVTLIRNRTGAPRVHLVAHSMGGLVVRCMMQKTCFRPGDDGRARLPARELVASVFTYGTPHGGIAFRAEAMDAVERVLGPVGSDVFAPEKMYGYLTPGADFGSEPPHGAHWDPQAVPADVFPAEDIFCLIGTDPKDYGPARTVVGPRSDGLVRIENAYVRRAHRAYVHRSHSGPYGEVNSEEGYQNLRRFLFGRWRVRVDLVDVPPAPDGEVWQADLNLAIRGLPVLMSRQAAADWCPIALTGEAVTGESADDRAVADEAVNGKAAGSGGRRVVPLVSTFLLDPDRPLPDGTDREPGPHEGRLRYTLTLRIFSLREAKGSFSFEDHLEQVPAWEDSLVADIGPGPGGSGLQAWVAWNSQVAGANDLFDPISDGLPPELRQRQPVSLRPQDGELGCRVGLPAAALALPVLGPDGALRLSVRDREDAPRR